MSDKFYPDVMLIAGALFSAVLVFIAGSLYGPGLTFDSVNYLYAGVSLSESGKLMRPQQQPYVQWPPLFPILIALLHLLPGTLLKTIFYFQVALAGITVWISGKILQGFVQHTSILLIAYLALVCSSPLILIHHFVWSESLFVLLIAIYIYLFSGYLSNPTLSTFGLLIILGNLLCLQRLAGAYFITGGVCLIWFYATDGSRIYRFLRGCVFGALSVLSLIIWWIYNTWVHSNFLAEFVLIKKSHLQHFLDFNFIFTSWFLPQQFPVWIRIVTVYLLIGYLVYLSVKFRRNKETVLPPSDHALAVLISLFLSYFILLYISINAIDVLDDRILAPAYVPGMLLFFGLLDRSINRLNKAIRLWVVAACCLWLLYPVTRAIYNVRFWRNIPVQPPAEQPVEPKFLEKLRF